ncbi:MAG: gliding motility-associated C-terminal domain-containing protein [Bacteroidales bacterium]|nr:gliding motility-associated C-terminal domain-containing protein [Bacteroidales bacterium]
MDLKNYREMPDSGLYEKIERRVRMRRVARVGGMTLAAVVVVGAAVWLLVPAGGTEKSAPTEVAAVQTTHPATPTETLSEAVKTLEIREAAPAVQQTVAPEERPVEEAIQIQTTSTAVAEAVTTIGDKVVVKSETTEPLTTAPASLATEERLEMASADTVHPTKGGNPTSETQHYDNVLFAPNAIAPMSDDEENRVFKVHSTSPVGDFHLLIYNRNGRQVFHSNDINRGWDATHNGNLVPQGAYVWVARFRDSDGVMRQEKGTVTVVR